MRTVSALSSSEQINDSETPSAHELQEGLFRADFALPRLAAMLFEFLTTELKLTSQTVARSLWRDYRRGGRRDPPPFLRDYLNDKETASAFRLQTPACPARQARRFARIASE